MIGCDDALRLMNLADDGEPVEETDRAALEAHCASCSACAATRHELAALGALVRADYPARLPEALRARVAGALAVEQARERYWAEAGGFASRLLRVAAAVAIVTGLTAAAVIARDPAAMGSATEPHEQAATMEAYVYGELAFNAEAVADVALGGRAPVGDADER